MMLPRNISLNFRLVFLAYLLFLYKIGVWGCGVVKYLKAARAAALDGPVGGDPLINLGSLQLSM